MRNALLAVLAASSVLSLSLTSACVGDDPAAVVTVPAGNDAEAGPTDTPDSEAPSDADGASPAAECEAGARRCQQNRPQSCAKGAWRDEAPCSDADAYRCIDGQCAAAPSCAGLLANCGSNAKSCCESPRVDTATFFRNFRPANQSQTLPATVSSFRLDMFEVTVGRFRAFLQAGGGTAARPPAAGAGAHPKIADSGWQSAWNASLAADRAAVESNLKSCESRAGSTWGDVLAGKEKNPVNCVTWVEAFAFCAWDGGRLPTAAELNLAAVGGSQQRKYPWGADALSAAHAVYCPNAGTTQCTAASAIVDVGSKPTGAGRWGHLDLIGSLREYALDYSTPIPQACTDCAQLDNSTTQSRGAIGWSWSDTATMIDTFGLSTNLSARTSAGGFRCARDL